MLKKVVQQKVQLERQAFMSVQSETFAFFFFFRTDLTAEQVFFIFIYISQKLSFIYSLKQTHTLWKKPKHL